MVKFRQEEVSSTSEVETYKKEKKSAKTVTFNLKDTSKDDVVGHDKDIVNDDESNIISSQQTLTNQEKNVEIQVRRVRQSIDLNYNQTYSSKNLHCNIILFFESLSENIYSYKFYLFVFSFSCICDMKSYAVYFTRCGTTLILLSKFQIH